MCRRCILGTYANGTGTTACQKCGGYLVGTKLGAVSKMDGCTSCDSGQGWDQETFSCIECDVGEYGNHSQCKKCPKNMIK
jgi:hypothetical protein